MRRLALLVLMAMMGAACSAEDAVVATSQPVALPTTTTSTLTLVEPPTTVTATTVPLPALEGLELEPVASGFQELVAARIDPGSGVLLAVERRGVIHALDVGMALDISDRVGSRNQEQGLLGLAFHPDDSNLLYLNYTDRNGDTVVSEFQRVAGIFDATTERIVLEVDQPASNHNGGHLEFGPDGFLYIGLGDGGGANDNFGNGQDPTGALGSMLRIDPRPSGSDPYTVPSDNPFADAEGTQAAVWAYGLRNPWRYTFDGDDLYVADVGQRRWEEVSVVSIDQVEPGGLFNFGWPVLEGSSCFAGGSDCDRIEMVEPVTEYSHDNGCSISGGVVMHDPALPEFDGFYLYGDYCGRWVRALHQEDGVVLSDEELFSGVGQVVGFAVGADGSALVLSLNGSIERIVGVRATG